MASVAEFDLRNTTWKLVYDWFSGYLIHHKPEHWRAYPGYSRESWRHGFALEVDKSPFAPTHYLYKDDRSRNGLTVKLKELTLDGIRVVIECHDPDLESFFTSLQDIIKNEWRLDTSKDDTSLLVPCNGLKGRDQKLLAMWQRNESVSAIAQHLNIEPRTVYNKTSEWRSIYGEDVVPRRR